MKKAIKEIIKWIVRGAIYIWFKIFYGAEIKGLENIPKEGALIFCGNHRSYLDPPFNGCYSQKRFEVFSKRRTL